MKVGYWTPIHRTFFLIKWQKYIRRSSIIPGSLD